MIIILDFECARKLLVLLRYVFFLENIFSVKKSALIFLWHTSKDLDYSLDGTLFETLFEISITINQKKIVFKCRYIGFIFIEF